MRALHEAHVALAQPPGQQALPSEIGSDRIVQAVKLLGRRGFLLDLERFRCLRLHPERQLERLDPRFQARIELPHLRVPPVDVAEHVEFVPLLLLREALVGEVLDGLALHVGDVQPRVPDRRALERSRQEGRGPVLGAAVRECGLDRDVARKVLILRAQTVDHPRPEAGPRERAGSGECLQQRRPVIDALAHHRMHEAKVVHALADMGEEIADEDPALAAGLEVPQGLHQRTRLFVVER